MTALTVQASPASDRDAILAAARSVGVFNAEEVDTVAELFDGYLRDPRASGYNFLSCAAQGELLGFACWGPTALSQGATDLYWICTAQAAQGRGAAAALFAAVEAAVRAAGRWLIVIWTSSRAEYAPARRFYIRMSCELQTQVRDFYDRGEDLCVYVRRLDEGITGQGSRVKNQGSRVKGQGSRVKGQGSRVKGQGSRIKDQGSRIKDHVTHDT